MSYLNTLIASARGRPQGLQPRLVARFENPAPAPVPGLADGLNEAPPVAFSTAPTAAPSTTAQRPTAPHSTTHQYAAPRANGAHQSTPASTENPVAASDAPPTTAPVLPNEARSATANPMPESALAATDRAAVPGTASPPPAIPRGAPPVVAAAERPTDATTAPPWQPAPLRPAGRPNLPQAVAAAAPLARPAPASPVAAPAPTVRVSIGRIDVRADPTPAKATPRTAAARTAGESALTRYLNQRGRP